MHDVKSSRRQALLQPLQDGLPSLLRQICMPSASRLRKEGCPGTGEQNLCCHVAGIFVGLLAQAPFVQYCFRIRTQVFAVQSTGMGMPSRTWIQKVQKRTCALNAHPFATSLCVSLHADSCILYGIMPHDILVSHQTCSSSHAGGAHWPDERLYMHDSSLHPLGKPTWAVHCCSISGPMPKPARSLRL